MVGWGDGSVVGEQTSSLRTCWSVSGGPREAVSKARRWLLWFLMSFMAHPCLCAC